MPRTNGVSCEKVESQEGRRQSPSYFENVVQQKHASLGDLSRRANRTFSTRPTGLNGLTTQMVGQYKFTIISGITNAHWKTRPIEFSVVSCGPKLLPIVCGRREVTYGQVAQRKSPKLLTWKSRFRNSPCPPEPEPLPAQTSRYSSRGWHDLQGRR